MTIIAQEAENNQERESRISLFFKKYEIGKLLKKCNANKTTGIPVIDIFWYLICLMFSNRSMYMQIATNRFTEKFSKNTVYRFLNNSKINWEKFTVMLSEKIINQFIRPLTSEERDDVFIVDDSTYHKTSNKKTELVAKVFDHVSMKYVKGFRMLTLGWSDGNSFIPINQRLLSSIKDENVLGLLKNYDKRSLAYKRRKQAREKATDVMIDMLKTAIKSGHHAKYVLFDSWFSNPKTVIQIKKKCKLDTIAMVKKSSKIHYVFDGKSLNIKQIYSLCKKRPGRSKYLLSVRIELTAENDKGEKESIPAKIICVRNRSNKKDWLAIICTNSDLSEEEIIRIYGKRWDIEVFFKSCKSMLKLESGCRSLSYDALTAYVSIVFTRYMILSVEKRIDEDDRTMGELFFLISDELQDITFDKSLSIIVQALWDSVIEFLTLTHEQISELFKNFIERLPIYLRNSLQISVN